MPPTIKSTATHDFHPLSPSIRTSRASQAIGDWGLKRNLPRLKMENITISDIDTQEHQTPFNSGNRFTKVVERWQEMGIPVKAQLVPKEYSVRLDYQASLPENVNQGIHLGSLPRKELKRMVSKARAARSSFLRSLGEGKPDVYSKQTLASVKHKSSDYLGIVPSTRNTFTVQPNGGLGYHPQGSLSLYNTPDGPRERIVTGRILYNRGVTFAGVGGVVSEVPSFRSNTVTKAKGREATVKLYGGSMEMQYNGVMKVTVDSARNDQPDRDRALGLLPFTEYSRDPEDYFGTQGYEDHEMEPSQKSITKKRPNNTTSALRDLLASSPVVKSEKED